MFDLNLKFKKPDKLHKYFNSNKDKDTFIVVTKLKSAKTVIKEEIKDLAWKDAHIYLAKHGYGPGNISAIKKEWREAQKEKKSTSEKDK